MALANFFDKSVAAASHVLSGFDPSAFRQKLEAQNIGILFDAGTLKSTEGRVALELSVNLAARLYPRISLCGPKADFADETKRMATEINPAIELHKTTSGLTSAVNLATRSRKTTCPQVFIGSEGWNARLSPASFLGWGSSANPFGAAVAACFGAANIFRSVFKDQLSHGGLDVNLGLAVDELVTGQASLRSSCDHSDIGQVALIGVGAIGNAFVWALSKVAGITGTLELIDHQLVDLSNLQRYVFATQHHIGASKVSLAQKALEATRLKVQAHQMSWGSFFASQPNHALDVVAVALDTASDRCAVQASLPRRIINAWTQPENLGISRHTFLGDQACLMCLYLPDGQTPSEDKLIAEAIGLPQLEMLIRDMLYRDLPITANLLNQISTAKSIPIETLQRFEGKSLRVFYHEAVCGRAILQFSTQDASQVAPAPLAFQSALAGILQASEIVLGSDKQRTERIQTKTTINLLRPLAPYLSFPHGKHPSQKCICQDPDYVSAYQSKFPN